MQIKIGRIETYSYNSKGIHYIIEKVTNGEVQTLFLHKDELARFAKLVNNFSNSEANCVPGTEPRWQNTPPERI